MVYCIFLSMLMFFKSWLLPESCGCPWLQAVSRLSRVSPCHPWAVADEPEMIDVEVYWPRSQLNLSSLIFSIHFVIFVFKFHLSFFSPSFVASCLSNPVTFTDCSLIYLGMSISSLPWRFLNTIVAVWSTWVLKLDLIWQKIEILRNLSIQGMLSFIIG